MAARSLKFKIEPEITIHVNADNTVTFALLKAFVAGIRAGVVVGSKLAGIRTTVYHGGVDMAAPEEESAD